MKKLYDFYYLKPIFTLCMFLALLTLFSGCSPQVKKVDVGVKANVADNYKPNGLSSSQSVNSGNGVNRIDSYLVTFKKVEIGNSESDKFTLWENSEGELKDVINEINFNSEKQITAGTYKYVRLTIGTELLFKGSVNYNGTAYNGSGKCTLDNGVYLWGTNIENSAGEVTLQSPVEITGDCNLIFKFDIANTATYSSGTMDNAVLNVIKPVMHVEVANK